MQTYQIVKVLENDIVKKQMEIKDCYFSKLRHAPITSCDVKGSFSAHKLIFTDEHHQLSTNTAKMSVAYCNLIYNHN